MNRTFKIIKNALGQYVVAGELAKTKGKAKSLTHLLLLSTLVPFSLTSQASLVRGDVDYQEFRNFAENKGKYQPGAVNIPVYDNNGNYLGTVLPQDVPMPDFSATNFGTGVATLVNIPSRLGVNSNQFIASVAHNTNVRLNNLYFGSRSYQVASYNRASTYWQDIPEEQRDYLEGIQNNYDFALPRLSKMVTGVSGVEMPHLWGGLSYDSIYSIPSEYTAFARLGSGTQEVWNHTTNTNDSKMGAYVYLTGGTPVAPINGYDYDTADIENPSLQKGKYIVTRGNIFSLLTNENGKSGPLATYTLKGDSGSPLYAYNSSMGRWELFAFTQGGTVCKIEHCFVENDYVQNRWTVIDSEFINKITTENERDLPVLLYSWGGSTYHWYTKYDEPGLSYLTTVREYDGGYYGDFVGGTPLKITDPSRYSDTDKGAAAIDNGQDLHLSDGLTVNLEQPIDQGAGGIYLTYGEASVTATHGSNTWVGSGVYVGENARLNWRVKQPEQARELEDGNYGFMDILSKLGGGTLYVNGQGINHGGISVGDGEVQLDQQADAMGNQQAFSSVELTGGRGTVTLMGDNQVEEDNFSFGYHGGKLDLNGHNVTLTGLRNYDDGGNIVNHNQSQASNLILKPYVYVSVYYDNFKGFLGAKSGEAKTNGELNVEIQKTVDGKRERKYYYLTGGANLNGSLTANGTTVTLQGKNNPYADIITQGDNGWVSQAVTNSADWVNRDYRVKNLSVNQEGTVNIGRNVTALSAETISVKDNSTLNLGFKKGSNFSAFDDRQQPFSGEDLTPDFYHLLPTTQAVVNEVNLTNHSTLNIHKATLTSRISGDETSTATLWADSTWNMNGDSYVQQLVQKSGSTLSATAGKLTATINAEADSSTTFGSGTIWELLGDSTVDQLKLNNAAIRLNPQNEFSRFNTLNVLSKLSGEGLFYFNTDLAGLLGNKVKVKDVEGVHTIAVRDSGREVSRAAPGKLALFEISGNSDSATFKLQNGYVHAGAFRYSLEHLVNTVAELTDPIFEQEEKRKAEEEAERQRLEEEKRRAEEEAERQRLEEEKRKAEEAEHQRLEEERRKAEEAERQRLEEERRKAEEAERQRLEEEKRRAEEEAERQRLEEEKRRAEEAERQRLEEEKRRAEEAERQRLEEEKRRAEEEAERQRLEEEKRRAEEAERQRLEEEKRRAEEAERQRLEEEKRRAEEAERQRLEEEKRRAEEAERQRLEEEKRRAEEAERQRLEEEKRRAEEEAERQRLEEEKRRAEEAERQRLEEEKRRAEEAERQRLEEEKRRAEEAERQRLEEEKRRAEEAERQRLEEEKRRAEEAERQRLEEEKRRAEEAERQRLEEERRRAEEAERQRLEEERRKAEEAERQRLEEERRRAEEAERQRLEEERRKAEEAERQRLEEERRRAEEAERQRLEEERRKAEEAERQRLEEEKRRAEEERQRLEEEKRRAEEAERQRLEEEKRRAAEAERQRLEEEKRRAEEAERQRLEEEKRRAEEEAERQRLEEEKRRAEEAERQRLEEEKRRAEEAERQRFEEEKRRAEEAERQRLEEEKRRTEEAERQRLEEEKRRAEEAERQRLEEEKRRAEEAERQHLEEEKRQAEEAERQRLEEEKHQAEEEAERQRLEEEKRRAEKPQKEIISKYTNAAISDAVISVQTILNSTKDIKQHLAQTQLSEVGQVNVWSRINSGKKHYDSEYYRTFKSRQTQTQLGVDTLVAKDLQVGAVMTQTRNTNNFADAISDKNKLLFGSVYAKYRWDNGVFVALDVGAGKLESEISLGKVKFHRNVTQAGLSAGKAFNIEALEIKPTVGISRSYLSSSRYELDQAQVNVDETQITSLSAGLELGYNMTFDDFSVKPTLSAYYVKNNGDSQVKVNGYSFNYEIEEQQHYNAGIALKYKQVSLELNGGVTKGSQSGKQRSAGAKISWTF